MGGAKIINKKDKRFIKNNKEFWTAIIRQAELNVDEFSFTVEDVVRALGNRYSGTTITRGRGGLLQMLLDDRAEFLAVIPQIVEEEAGNIGDISVTFCRKLSFLIVDYGHLFALDIVTHSHHNSELLLKPTTVLILPDKYLSFGAELYALLREWYQDTGFTRASAIEKYEGKIRSIILKYQIVRPDMAVTQG